MLKVGPLSLKVGGAFPRGGAIQVVLHAGRFQGRLQFLCLGRLCCAVAASLAACAVSSLVRVGDWLPVGGPVSVGGRRSGLAQLRKKKSFCLTDK